MERKQKRDYTCNSRSWQKILAMNITYNIHLNNNKFNLRLLTIEAKFSIEAITQTKREKDKTLHPQKDYTKNIRRKKIPKLTV